MSIRPPTALRQLVDMSRRLGAPENDYVILGGGNTSAQIDEQTFWVKASGAALAGIGSEDFVQVRSAPILELVEAEEVSDELVKRTLTESCVQADGPRPSVETFFHALLLRLDGVSFIGHTHPTAVNAVTCSQRAEEALSGRLLPEEIVVCGLAPIWVPFAESGIALARRLRQLLADYVDRYRRRPRCVWIQNHGLIALGGSPQEVESITVMSVQVARILVGTYALGGPHFLTDKQIERIATCPDEAPRLDQLGLTPP